MKCYCIIIFIVSLYFTIACEEEGFSDILFMRAMRLREVGGI